MQVVQGMFVDEIKEKKIPSNPSCIPSLYARVGLVNVTATKVSCQSFRATSSMTMGSNYMVSTRSRLKAKDVHLIWWGQGGNRVV